ncbi:F-box/FBD/LRR-repeat protein [Carex littledalei]|uniref:F-box/FBD/LRR-repeat protein n=1 Tax=Carex littledalei TaxID=544730 RepID=A0A833QA99_9POAL|nr:F-box/FBD/LRR-repeat protein [Carex littledalei]
MKKTSAKTKIKMDRLSGLPDEVVITVLSLLPTLIAARTSVLSRRFRDLWKASPSVDLPFIYIPSFKHSTYVAMANSVLLSRRDSLVRLHLKFGHQISGDLTKSFISSLLLHAHALGLRHLTIHGRAYWDFESILRSVFSSCTSLQSLSIHILPLKPFPFPSAIALTRLKSLSINFISYNSTIIKRLLSELSSLEHLQLHMFSGFVCLSSPTIKKLELLLLGESHHLEEPYSLGLFMPSLEFLSLTNYHDSFHANSNIPLIHGEIPLIRIAVVTLRGLRQKHITAVAQFLNFISYVQRLTLNLKEHRWEEYPFPLFMEPGKEAPTFPNLKHLDMSLCFHECNFEAVVTMLHHSTALESLKLHHKTSDILGDGNGRINAWGLKWPRNGDQSRKRNAWRSKLPRNRDEQTLNI